MADPKPGDRVGEYVLLEQIGAGSFGQIWKARHHIWSDQLVAVKIPTDLQYVRTLRREGVVVHGLKHPNIVRAIGLDPYADPPYYTMELVDGPSLRQLIDEHPDGLPIDAALVVFEGVLLALQEAHNTGLVHRDIKPANILLEGGGNASELSAAQVKVTDFGLGRAGGLTTASIMQSGSMVTGEGKSISGTLAYMAPEQLDGSEVDARSDIYSCGVVLFEMLCGSRPHGHELPSQRRGEVPGWLDQIFSRCYTRRDRRYESARAVLDAMELKAQPIGQARAASPPPPPPLPRRTLRTACPKCKKPIEPGDNFCIHCGRQVVAHPRTCPGCGAYPEPYDRFCIFCGGSLERVD